MKILLHVCCGPCAAHVARELARHHNVTLFFYNPNAWPEAEYGKRLDAARRLAETVGLPLVVGEYDASAWESAVRGLEQEPEGGRRCEVCFEFRLAKTAQTAASEGFDTFTTTLSVSPHKDAATISRIGARLAKSPLVRGDSGGCLPESPLAKGDSGGCFPPAGPRPVAACGATLLPGLSLRAAARQSQPLQFLAEDFKKHDGFKKSLGACRELDLYRQTYCGCKYSVRSRHDKARCPERT
ncbi:MAG: epoxyqueuosine reductase QueH [Planctomycetota bacterium]|nr:epoxyqueuosine reductase QueH [Planctomycetota bacterium]